MIHIADRARMAALEALYHIDVDHSYSNLRIKEILRDHRLTDLDRAFASELIYGVTRYRLTLDWIIGLYSHIKKLSPWVNNALRMGIYQILYMDKVPVFAACDSSVELVKRKAGIKSAGFVNAVIRRLLKEKDNIADRLPSDFISHVSLEYSFPQWMISLWKDLLGMCGVEELCRALNQKAPLDVRVNTLKIRLDEFKQELDKRHIGYQSGRYVDEALMLDGCDVERLPGYKEGWFAVQDEASMLVAYVLDPKPGYMIIDACSAPGGKATHMAQLMNDHGKIWALDIHSHRVELIKAQCARLGITSVEAMEYDSTIFNAAWENKANAVLIDAPCSGLGIIRRKPDIKWTKTPKDIRLLIDMQRRLLETCSRYVKQGGVLVYSTCTINPEENQDMIRWFLTNNSRFSIMDIVGKLPLPLRDYVDYRYGCIQLYPHRDGVDGFFIAGMIRTR